MIQAKTCCTIARDSGGSPISRHTTAADTANEASIDPQAMAPAALLLIRRPRKAFSRKPASGKSGISSSMSGRRCNHENAEDTREDALLGDAPCLCVSSVQFTISGSRTNPG